MAADAQPAGSEPLPGGGRASATNWMLVGILLVGAAVSVALGVFGKVHKATFSNTTTLGFPTMFDMKVWLTTFATVLAFVQLGTALRMYGRIGHGPAPRAVALTHRISGVVAVVLTLPVVYHCLFSLGFQTIDTRVLLHSLLGCAFYGVFVAKMLALQAHGLPGWTIPVLGGLLFTVLVSIWLSSSLWFFVTNPQGY